MVDILISLKELVKSSYVSEIKKTYIFIGEALIVWALVWLFSRRCSSLEGGSCSTRNRFQWLCVSVALGIVFLILIRCMGTMRCVSVLSEAQKAYLFWAVGSVLWGGVEYLHDQVFGPKEGALQRLYNVTIGRVIGVFVVTTFLWALNFYE